MESPIQVDVNPSKKELEVQPISELAVNENETVESLKPENQIQKLILLLWKKNEDPHFIESWLCPPFIKVWI